MSNKIKIILAIVVIIVLLMVVLLVLSLGGDDVDKGESGTGQVFDKTGDSQDGQLPLPGSGIIPPKVPDRQPVGGRSVLSEAELTKQKLARLGSSFAAVYGSYSNQSNFENMRDLKHIMTEKMRAQVDDYIVTHTSPARPKIYFGVTTKSLKAEVESLTDEQARVLVNTQRKESAGATGSDRVYYQVLEIDYRRVGGVWKVDGAEWK